MYSRATLVFRKGKTDLGPTELPAFWHVSWWDRTGEPVTVRVARWAVSVVCSCPREDDLVGLL